MTDHKLYYCDFFSQIYICPLGLALFLRHYSIVNDETSHRYLSLHCHCNMKVICSSWPTFLILLIILKFKYFHCFQLQSSVTTRLIDDIHKSIQFDIVSAMLVSFAWSVFHALLNIAKFTSTVASGFSETAFIITLSLQHKSHFLNWLCWTYPAA